MDVGCQECALLVRPADDLDRHEYELSTVQCYRGDGTVGHYWLYVWDATLKQFFRFDDQAGVSEVLAPGGCALLVPFCVCTGVLISSMIGRRVGWTCYWLGCGSC